MGLALHGVQRRRFAEDLLQHRNSFPDSDGDYAANVLHISLNTFKKCVDPALFKALSLRRNTFVNIFARSGLNPARYGLNIVLPATVLHHGGYANEEFGFLCGRYFVHRRSFLTGTNINRSVLDISWSDEQTCLVFRESLRYRSDSGVAQRLDYNGEVFMHADRILLGLLSFEAGEVRLMTVHTPSRRSPGQPVLGPIKVHGALLAHGFPRGYFQPVVTPVVIESVPKGTPPDIEKLCRTIKSKDEDYERIIRDLIHAEEHTVIMTPLLARKLAI